MCAICIHPADGHHKLIRWRTVTHGSIDAGFSRPVLFLQCSTNNRASTVYDLFPGAIGQYGLHSWVRTDDLGRENMQVAQHMLQNRGVNRRSIIVGSSVHNQRIERLWKDSHRCATSFFTSFSTTWYNMTFWIPRMKNTYLHYTVSISQG